MNLKKDRNFLYIISANTLANIGSGIAMIGIPWHLLNQVNGERSLGIITFITTGLLFILSPYLGIIIDRYSRKKLELIYNLLGFLLVFAFALWGLFLGEYQSYHLMILYMVGSLYFTFHFQTMLGMTQELFAKDTYQTLNSVLEIQNQVANVIAGGLAGILIARWGLVNILLVNAGTYLAAFVFYLLIKYQKSQSINFTKKVSAIEDFKAGWKYLRQQPSLSIFYLATYIPFSIVMLINYVFPVYVRKTLHAGPVVFGLYEVIFSCGSVLAGLVIVVLTKRLGKERFIILNATIITISMFCLPILPLASVFLVMNVMIGFGSAGVKITRRTIMMENIPTSIVGRVNSFYSIVEIALRLTFISIFTAMISKTGTTIPLLIMGTLLLFSVFFIMYCQKGVKREFALSNESLK
ncbi:MFS transporter [Cytobacillus sp. Hz8]|uniref:MFS transporter n=1 Tax=Cytobacillus sp. Hz8 TaxID=3347168 RepID=UPI0035E13A1B